MANTATRSTPRPAAGGGLFEEGKPIAKTTAKGLRSDKNAVGQPFYHWTAELLAKGFSVMEVAEIRRLDSQIILEHALAAAKSGKQVPKSAFEGYKFPPESDEVWEMLKPMLR